MKYSAIIYSDCANGIGIRTSLFVSGCRNNCKGCFNKDLQDFNHGKEYTNNIKQSILDRVVDNNYYSGISLLGGEPMEPENAKELISLVSELKDRDKTKTVWTFTGYTYEFLAGFIGSDPRSILLSYTDILVDGPFELDKRDLTLKFRGSTNQRIIDVKESKKTGNIVLWKG